MTIISVSSYLYRTRQYFHTFCHLEVPPNNPPITTTYYAHDVVNYATTWHHR